MCKMINGTHMKVIVAFDMISKAVCGNHCLKTEMNPMVVAFFNRTPLNP